MYLISPKGYENAGIRLLIEKKTGIIWASMKNVQEGLGVQNTFDLVLKEIYGIYKTKIPTKDQIRKYKMTEREIFEKYANLSENELYAKNNKYIYAKNDVMTTVIKRCRGKTKIGERKIDGFRKIGNIFSNEKILEEYSMKKY